jgi:hypothetical protein
MTDLKWKEELLRRAELAGNGYNWADDRPSAESRRIAKALLEKSESREAGVERRDKELHEMRYSRNGWRAVAILLAIICGLLLAAVR